MTLKLDSWLDALKLRAEQRHASSSERLGQAYFNVLYFEGFDPTFADTIRGGLLDPFYDDTTIPKMLVALKEWRITRPE